MVSSISFLASTCFSPLVFEKNGLPHCMHVCKEDSPTMIFLVIKKTSENNLHYVEGFPEEKIILTL